MRVELRRKVDISKPLEMSELAPLERVITAIRYKYSTSRLHKSGVEKEANKQLKLRMKRMEDLKQVLLYNFTTKLSKNGTTKSIEVTVGREFQDILEDTITSADFIAFKINILKENRDILTAFPELPIIMEVRRI